MTHNQINYWNLQETGRHNVVTEKETNRHNVMTENIDIGKLNETIRHNKATEGIQSGTLRESQRHNIATEQYNLGQLSESVRHNKELESQGRTDLNIKSESLQETGRHNVSTEGIQQQQADVAQQQADTAKLKAVADAKYTDTMTTWYGLSQEAKNKLTDVQRQEVETKISQLEQQMKIAKQQNVRDWYSKVLQTSDSIARIIDAIIPG